MAEPDSLYIQTLGEIKVVSPQGPLSIPPSRKTRALLGYLLLSGVPQRRERLCELFWDAPDDPRGALRWSLSKLRGALNGPDKACLVADRERVSIDTSQITVDVLEATRLASDKAATALALTDAWNACMQPLLADCELPNSASFSAWLERERMGLARLRAKLARRLALMAELPPDETARWARAWLDDAPFDHEAAVHAVSASLAAGRVDEATALQDTLNQHFAAAKRPAPDWSAIGLAGQDAVVDPPVPDEEWDRTLRVSQRIRFLKARDGASLAWATVGDDAAPPLVKAANWLSHLELDWDAPIWSPLFRDLARHRRLVRYDERGCGLSDWDVPDISFETFVRDLEDVVDAAGLERFPLLGISQGASVSIEYAARHPERVSHLILFGGYPAGWRHLAPPQEVREREAVMVLTGAGWGRDDPSYRHLFSRTFMPTATADELAWFDDFQRQTTSPANAVRFLEAFSSIDVRHRLAELRVPTLVLHARGDQRIPLSTGRELAASIHGAELVGLDSTNHLLLGREPASAAFLSAVRDFLARHR